MFRPSDIPKPGRVAALTGASLLAIAALLMQVPLGAAAGVSAKGGTVAAADDPPAAARPPAPAVPATPAPKPHGSYRLRCWQYGKLLFDEGAVSLGADARQSAKLVVTDRNGAPLLVTDAGSATCLVRPDAPQPSLAMPR